MYKVTFEPNAPTSSRRIFFGMALNMILKILWRNVWFANKIKLRQLRPQVCCNLYPFQVNIWRRFQWILSQLYLSTKERVSSWWYLIDFPSMQTFVHYPIHLKQVSFYYIYGQNSKATWKPKVYCE